MTIENKEIITKCFCPQYSCELIYDRLNQPIKADDGTLINFIVSTTQRYSFIKEKGVICGGGIASGDIPTCRASKKYNFYDTIGDLKKAQNGEKNKNLKKKNKNMC